MTLALSPHQLIRPPSQFQVTGFCPHKQMSSFSDIQTALGVNLNDEQKTLVQSVLEVFAQIGSG